MYIQTTALADGAGEECGGALAVVPRTREQRRETVELSRDGGSSRLFSPRRRVGTGLDLVAVAAVVEHSRDAQGELGRRARHGSSRG